MIQEDLYGNYEAYRDYMIEMEPRCHKMIDMGDGTCLMLKPLLFHYTLLRMNIGDTEGYFDRWCYQDLSLMEKAVEEWESRNWEGEPEGWHRHPLTARRRPNGNKAEEYINW